jgi:DNA-binding NarL/FixJ family response regulator
MARVLRIHVAVGHSTMRHLLVDLLMFVQPALVTSAPQASALDSAWRTSDLLVIDEANFADTRCRNTVAATKALVLVVSAENDASSREAALAGGAHGWLPREHVGDELYAEISRMLAAPAATSDLDGAANVVLPEKSIRN